MTWKRSHLQGRQATGQRQVGTDEHSRDAFMPRGMPPTQVFLGYGIGTHGCLRRKFPRNQKSLRPQNTRKHPTQGRPSRPEQGYCIFCPERRYSNTVKHIRHGQRCDFFWQIHLISSPLFLKLKTCFMDVFRHRTQALCWFQSPPHPGSTSVHQCLLTPFPIIFFAMLTHLPLNSLYSVSPFGKYACIR